MTQRTRFIVYLVVVHLVFAALGVLLFLRNPLWLFPVEVLLAVSLATGIALTRGMFRNLEFASAGAQLMRDHDFTSRLLPVGQPEVDDLIAVYNRMVDNLRDERTRQQEQHHFLSHILRVSPSGIVILDFDRRIATMNPAAERLMGEWGGSGKVEKWKSGKVSGKVSGTVSGAVGLRLEDCGTPLSQALAALTPNATEVVSIDAARRVRCHHGTFIDRGFPRSFLLIEELTEELRQAERGAYEKLIRVMAHEVNNSATASNSLLQSCLTYGRELSDASRPDFEEALSIVIQRTTELNRFMRRFAEVFRLPPPVRRPEDVVGLLEQNVRLLSARPESAGVTWQWDIDHGRVSVPIDRGQMEQAFLNILQNAVDAVHGQGTITIRLHTRNGRPRVMIEDTGPGIASEAQANLFTPFFSTKPQGQGIGLTLVQEILAGHGFDYALERAPGEPTRFTIVF